MVSKAVIFIPTYNERENASRMCEEIDKIGLNADLLFVDDNSPDGTGHVLEALKEKYPRLIVQHRASKLGIGSAHLLAIEWAYNQGYDLLVTLDADFSHSPSDIPSLINAASNSDLSVGSRWAQPGSLPGWNIVRRTATWLGHMLTRTILGLSQDATGAFRVYRLDRIPREIFGIIKSSGYSFFFESLFILSRNGATIAEVPINLPARTYGHSKMSTAAAWRSARYVFELRFASLRNPERFLLEREQAQLDPALMASADWDRYWTKKNEKESAIYEFVAGVYRRLIIKRNLNRVIRRTFQTGAELLHAGCGGGQVDADLQHVMRLTAVDLSARALRLYCRNNPKAVAVRQADILHLPVPNDSFDGVYNLGVMEHFEEAQIVQILAEFRRVLRPGGKVVIFWPHARATSVLVLKLYHALTRLIVPTKPPLHPPEITYLRSRGQAGDFVARAGFKLLDYHFGISDLFVQAVIIAEKC